MCTSTITSQVELIGTDDETPLDTTTLDGKVYFHAEPGRCFRVKVSNTERDPNLERVIVNLNIDGEGVGYHKRLNLKENATFARFDGLYKMDKIYHFKFSETQLAPASEIEDSATKQCSSSEETNIFSAGSIEVRIYEAVEDANAEIIRVFAPTNKGLPSENKKIDKDKKFWAQPSVTTACADEGRPIGAYAPPRPWKRVSNVPLFSFIGYYHTPGLIKILQNMEQPPSADENALPSSSVSKRRGRETEAMGLAKDTKKSSGNKASASKKRRR